jgi:hypothetical protein
MIEVMQKTPLIVLMPLLILGGCTNVPEQVKPRPAGQTKPRPAEQAKPPMAAKPGGACALVTKAEIQEVIGKAIVAVTPMNDSKTDICAFNTKKGDEIRIYAAHSSGRRDLSNALGEARKALPSATIREVPGLGDKALLVEHPTRGTLLSVYRAGDTLVVSVLQAGPRSKADVAKADAEAEKIARKAFQRF